MRPEDAPPNKATGQDRKLGWSDAEEIAWRLHQKYPTIDPLTVRFTDLHSYVTELADFVDEPRASTEGRLEAIQMAWFEMWQEGQG